MRLEVERAVTSHGGLGETDCCPLPRVSGSVGPEWPRMCCANQIPEDAGAAGPGRTWRGIAAVVGVPGNRASLGQLSSTHSQAAFLSPSLQVTREALAQGSHSLDEWKRDFNPGPRGFKSVSILPQC